MTFFRKITNYTLYDHKRNQDIIKELKIEAVLEKMNNYKIKWMRHVPRMDRSRLPNAIIKYQPEGKRNPGCPLKTLLDCYIQTGECHKA
jgi:hypothetical protein